MPFRYLGIEISVSKDLLQLEVPKHWLELYVNEYEEWFIPFLVDL